MAEGVIIESCLHHKAGMVIFEASRAITELSNVTSLESIGNICSSGRILKTGMRLVNRSAKPDVLGSGTANYGHGSIMRGGGSAKCASSDVVNSASRNAWSVREGGLDPMEVKKAGNEIYKKGCFGEALGLYDKAIALAPGNATYRSNRATVLMGLGRVMEAVKECEEAVRLDPNYWRAHQRLGALLIM